MMKSSTLRWSFGSIHWSGLKVPSLPSPRGMMQAIRLVRSETSNVSILRAPLWPSRIRAQLGSTPQPSGVTMPSPVTTTRLICKTPARNRRAITRNRGTVRPRPVRLSHRPRGRQLFAFFSRNFVASPTVKIVSAASSGISQPNSSSNAITSSTVSRLSAPRSSMKLALSTTFSGSTPRCSTTIFLTRSPISLIVQPRACSIRPDAHPSHPSRVNSLVPVAVAHCPDLAPSLRTEARRMTAGSAPPIYRVSKSCNGVLCRAVRGCGYHTPATLTTSPNRSPERPSHFTDGLPTASKHGHSAIDVNRLPGDISSLVRTQIDRCRGDIVGRPKPRRRNLRQNGFALLVVERVRHRRCNKTGCNAIGGDIALGVFGAKRLDQADQPGLRCGVVRLAGIAGDADDRRYRDDAAEALAHHQLGRGARKAEGRGQVDLDHVVPVLIAQLHEKIVPCDAGIGDQNIDLPHRRLRRRYQRL